MECVGDCVSLLPPSAFSPVFLSWATYKREHTPSLSPPRPRFIRTIHPVVSSRHLLSSIWAATSSDSDRVAHSSVLQSRVGVSLQTSQKMWVKRKKDTPTDRQANDGSALLHVCAERRCNFAGCVWQRVCVCVLVHAPVSISLALFLCQHFLDSSMHKHFSIQR